jgi:hypothetical protein
MKNNRIMIKNLNMIIGLEYYSSRIAAKAGRIGHTLIDLFEFHYTPKHGNWLNMAETGLGVLTRLYLSRRIPEKSTFTIHTRYKPG